VVRECVKIASVFNSCQRNEVTTLSTQVPIVVTLNDLELSNGRYFTLFHQIRQLWANNVEWLKLDTSVTEMLPKKSTFTAI